MGINWFWRRRSNKKNVTPMPQAKPCSLEPLEDRQLMAVTPVVVTSSVADNRGFIQVRFNKTLQSSTINNTSVRVFTAGTDGTIGTTDDTQVTATLVYSNSKKLLTINANISADQGYRVKLYGSRIKDTDGLRLDGEFHVGSSGGASGNGVQGGDYQFRVKRDTGATPIARMTSNMGDIDVRLFRGASAFSTIATPNAVANFLKYINAGDWDNLVMTRLANNFVEQMGHVRLTAGGALTDVPDKTPVGSLLGEPGNTNARGTLAWALSAGPDTATNQFFFNWGDNNSSSAPNNLDESAGGGPFTVFAKVANSKGLAVIDAINALHRLDLTPAAPSHPELNNVPIRPTVTVEGENPITGGTTNQALNTFKDLVVFTHIGVLSKLVAIT